MLSKSDNKLLESISPYVNDLQNFVAANICNGRSMTADKVFEEFSKQNNVDIDKSIFVRAFRLLVKLGKISGIEGVKKLGYRQCGDQSASSKSQNPADILSPYIDDLRDFINKNIYGSNRMTSSIIYEKFSSQYDDFIIDEKDFKKAFAACIKEGLISGIRSAYKFGYERINNSSSLIDNTLDDASVSNNEEDKNNTSHCEIIIDNKRKLVAMDRFNWVYMIRKPSGTWVNEAYYGSFECAIKLSKKLLEEEVRTLQNIDIKELDNVVKNATDKICVLIDKLINQSKAA